MVGEELDLQDVLRFWVLNSNEWCIRITSPQERRSLTYTWCNYFSTRLCLPVCSWLTVWLPDLRWHELGKSWLSGRLYLLRLRCRHQRIPKCDS